MEKLLEIYDKTYDSWSRISFSPHKNLKELKLHIEILKKQGNDEFFYFIVNKNETNITEDYKFGIVGFYERYNSVENRNNAIKRMNLGSYCQYSNHYDSCPLII